MLTTYSPALWSDRRHPYYILAYDYRETSSGVVVLHLLCHVLNQLGYDAYVVAHKTNPNLRTPILNRQIEEAHQAAGRMPITIYPEVAYGNPLNAPFVVRYLLNVPGLLAGDKTFPRNEMIYAYRSQIIPKGMDADILYLPPTNTELFSSEGVEEKDRSGFCYYAHRYTELGGKYFHPLPGGVELSHAHPRTFGELATLFRQSEFMYAYEPSELCLQAMLCGCPVVYLPNEYMLECPATELMGRNGAAWGTSEEELSRAKATVGEVRKLYDKHVFEFWDQLNIFITKTQLAATKFVAESGWPARNVLRDSRKRIVVFSADPKSEARAQLRLLRPFQYLRADFELVWGFDENGIYSDTDLLNSADLVVLQGCHVLEKHRDFAEQVLQSGRPVILDLDESPFALPPDHARYQLAASKRELILSAIERVAAVIVPTTALADALRAVGNAKQIYVLANSVEPGTFLRTPAQQVAPVRIVMAGALTHTKDYAIVESALDKMLKKYDGKVLLVFMGQKLERWHQHPAVIFVAFEPDYSLYINVLPRFEFDIALVPLLNTPFNLCKSDIKWQEFAAAGVAGIYSNLEPYGDVRDGETGLKVANTSQAWFDAICDLVDHPEKRLNIAQAARTEVLEKHTTEIRARQYAQLYDEILSANSSVERIELPPERKEMEESEGAPTDYYQLWQLGHSFRKRDALWIAERMQALATRPRFHLAIILPEGQQDYLANNIKSLGHQFYAEWFLTIVATGPVHDALQDAANILWIETTPENQLAAANRSLLETPADWVGMWEAGDKLAPHALFSFADKVDRHPGLHLLYSDEDQVDMADAHSTPFFKTDFNLEMLRAAPFAIGGLLLCRRDLFAELNGFDLSLDGVEALDLALRAWEIFGHAGIAHVADVLYHRHAEGGHDRCSTEDIGSVHRRALAAHLARCGMQAVLDEGLLPGTLHVRYPVIGNPLVSILIPTKNQVEMLRRCLTSLIDGTGYSNCEILVLDNGSDEAEAVNYLAELRALDSPRLRVLDCAGPFNFSVMNNRAAREAQGEYLLLLNNDTAILHEEWLDEMLGIAQQADVGAVGAKLFYPNGTIQHAGVILGMNDAPADHPFSDHAAEESGYFGRLKLTQEFSAVTAACMLVKRALYLELDGLDETRFQVSYNDVDFCQRLRQRGYRVVFTPHARVLHEGSVSQRGTTEASAQAVKVARFAEEQNRFYDTWRHDVAFDPAYNRNLSTHGRDFLIEIAPALAWDPEWRPRPRVLAHPADRSGCGEYRIVAPMRALNEDARIMGWETGNYLTPPELFRMEPDVILLQRQVDPQQMEFIERYIRHSQAFRVYEIDDLITNIPIRSIRKKHFVEQKDLHKRFRKGISLCHRFIVSTDFLAEEYQGYCEDIVVVQNYIERARWGKFKPERMHRQKARVGWAGSVTHDGDLAVIFDVVKATAKEVDWVFFGMCPDEIRPYVAEFHAGVALEDYPAKLASLDLDLAVAPLEDVPFNHGKSHLRLLEYGVLGYPVICSDLTPYRGDYPVTRVASRFKDWVDAIRSHVADRDELARHGDVLRDYINANWILEDHLDIWQRAWLP